MHRMAEQADRPWQWLHRINAEHPDLLDKIRDQVARHGPLTARQIEHPDDREPGAWFIAAGQGRDVGTVEMRDLVDAVRAYFTARYSHLQAIHDLNVALANLERTSGSPVTQRWEPPCE